MKFSIRLVSMLGIAGLAASAYAAGASATLRQTVAPQPGDDALFAAADNPPSTYAALPGDHEFQGKMIVRPLTREAWQAKGLAADEIDARIARARARLAPLEWMFVAELNHILITLPNGVSENAMSAFLTATGDYQYAEPDWVVYPCAVPNDAQYPSQYAHQVCFSEPAWNVTTGSASVTIGVTDTGVRVDHEDLVPNLVSGANSASGVAVAQSAGGAVSDVNGHGSHTAGIVGARGGNSVGVSGMSWQNKIMPVRVSDVAGGGSTLTAIQAGALWAAQNGARIVSTSYSGVNNASNQTTGATMRSSYNALWFWAAGNATSNLGADLYPDLQIVSSTDSANNLSSFSNFGAAVDVAAPGSSILSTYNASSTSYQTLSGTSMACPAAAGAAGLVLAVNPSFSAAQVRDILFNNVDDLGPAGEDTSFGVGRINVGQAVADAYRISYPSALPFSDDFETGAFAVARWVYVDTGCAVTTAATGEPSGTYAAEVNSARRIETNAINLSGNTDAVNLTFATEARSIEAGETLNVEYLNASGTWISLANYSGPITAEVVFTPRTLAIPTSADARHAKFAVRFRSAGSDSTDKWYIDNVRIASSCAADFNGDSSIDFFDYLDFVDAFTSLNPAADFNGDSSIDFFDYLDFVNAFTTGC